ncbi:MAG TPA: glycosyltransferase family 8 protein, partial [Terrimicrobiaceae bacterium]
HVVTCSDPDFAIGAWMTIWSTHQCTPERKNLFFHLLTTEPNAPRFARLFRLAAKWGIQLGIKCTTSDAIKDLPTHRLPLSSYLRLLAPGILHGIEQFLYLDSDLLVRSSVQPLFKMLGEREVAAAARDYYFHDVSGSKLHERSPELYKEAPYFNSGVLQVNSDVWREQKVSERITSYLQLHGSAVSHGDQDGLNVVLTGELKEMDPSWNVQVGALQYYDRFGWPIERDSLRLRKAELLSDAKIVHFIGPSKPWRAGVTIPYGRQYRKMLVDSGWVPKRLAIAWRVLWLVSASSAITKAALEKNRKS